MIFFALQREHYDAGHAGNPLKQWLVYLRSYFPQASLLFERVKRLRDPDEIGTLLGEHAAQTAPAQQSAA